MAASRSEHLHAVFLNAQGGLLSSRLLASGGACSVAIDLSAVVREAVSAGAAALAVMHNHPSGSLMPSTHDIAFTHALEEFCDEAGIACVDHFIVSEMGIISLRQWGIH